MKGRNNTMKNNEKAALTTTNSTFLALKDFNLNDALTEELSGLSGSFERIKIPAAGMTVFEIPGENPDSPETVKIGRASCRERV